MNVVLKSSRNAKTIWVGTGIKSFDTYGLTKRWMTSILCKPNYKYLYFTYIGMFVMAQCSHYNIFCIGVYLSHRDSFFLKYYIGVSPRVFFNYNTRILTTTKKIHFILRKSCKTCNQIKWSNTYVIEKTQTYWQKLQDKAAYEYKRCNRNSRGHMILVNKYVKILLYPD